MPGIVELITASGAWEAAAPLTPPRRGALQSLPPRLPAKLGTGPCNQRDSCPLGSGSCFLPLHNRPLPLPVSPSPPQPLALPDRRLRLLCPARLQCLRHGRKPWGGAGRRSKREGGAPSQRCPAEQTESCDRTRGAPPTGPPASDFR